MCSDSHSEIIPVRNHNKGVKGIDFYPKPCTLYSKPLLPYAKLPNVATRTSLTPSRRPWQVVRLVFALLVVVGTVFLGARVLSRYFAISEVTLPNLVGLGSEEAQQTLQNLGLSPRVFPSIVADAPVNTVTSQSPQAGFVVRAGRSVSLEVNTPENVAVPSLLGSTQDQARAILQQVALELGTINYDFSNDIPEGQILSQNPPPTTNVASRSEISISVSRGPNVPTVAMPDVRGQNIDAAKSRLRGLGFTNIDTVPSSVSNEAPQTVTQQSPAAKQSVTVTTRVTLGYSLSSQIVRQVPSLVGLSLADAQVTLQSAGLVIGSVNFIEDPAQAKGIVTYAPSQYTLAGSPIMLTVNGYEPIPTQPPTFTQGQGQQNPQNPQPLTQTPVGPEAPEASPSTLTGPSPGADSSREIPFTFDPSIIGISQLMQQDYNLRLAVTDEQGERELLNRKIPAGQAITASFKVYGEATLQTYINDVLFMAWNP
jgi:beta-lactam-binding protein with PASTA domain